MSQAVLEKIEELFGDPSKFSPENVENLVQETLQFFNGLRTMLDSKDEKERAEAVQLAVVLKTKLEEQALELCQTVGMDPQALETYMSDPSHFSSEEWQAMEKARRELDDYKEELSSKSIEPTLKVVK